MRGCNCSAEQLEKVGCDCVEMIVEIWPKGYADEAGPKREVMSHRAVFSAEAIRMFGHSAVVFAVRERKPVRPVEKFSAEYIREMSKGG